MSNLDRWRLNRLSFRFQRGWTTPQCFPSLRFCLLAFSRSISVSRCFPAYSGHNEPARVRLPYHYIAKHPEGLAPKYLPLIGHANVPFTNYFMYFMYLLCTMYSSTLLSIWQVQLGLFRNNAIPTRNRLQTDCHSRSFRSKAWMTADS